MGRLPDILQQAQYKEIAVTLRDAMRAKGLTASTLNEAMGIKRAHPTIYSILNGKTAPSKAYRVMLAKALGVNENQLVSKPLMSGQEALPVALMPRDAPGPESLPSKPGSLLAFNVDQAGIASIQFNLRLPMAKAIELLNELQAKGLLNG